MASRFAHSTAFLTLALIIAGGSCLFAQDGVPLALSSSAREVAITLRVGSDAALVQETAEVFVPEGKSSVRFEWTDADIDPASIRLDGPEDIKIGGARQTAGAQKTYTWPVLAERSAGRLLTASYFLKGIKWTASYTLTLDAAAGTVDLVGKLHLTNDSKLPLKSAWLQLCAAPVGVLGALDEAEGDVPSGTYLALQDCTLEPGRQKRIIFFRAEDLPFRILHRADPEAYKTEVRSYLLVDLSKLAVPATLPTGHLEVYERTAAGRMPVVGTDLVHAADKETEVFIGSQPNVVFERTVTNTRKTDVEFDRLGRVSGYDITDDLVAVFRNRTGTPLELELIERVPGKWDCTTDPAPTKREANELRWTLKMEPGAESQVSFTIVRRTGSRAD
jgi:hypothetical protein